MIQVILAQVGTIEELSKKSIRKYLKRFLYDDRIIDLPKVLWWPLSRLIALLRAGKTLPLYASIWKEGGMPLKTISEKQRDLLQKKLGGKYSVELFLSYTDNHTLGASEERRKKAGIENVIVLPLFPQRSTATTNSIADAVYSTLLGWKKFGKKEKKTFPNVHFISHFYKSKEYQRLYTTHLQNELAKQKKNEGKCIVSFHGLPKRYIKEGDEYQKECEETFVAIKKSFPEKARANFALAYQSRFGPEKWLSPTTKNEVERMARDYPNEMIFLVCPGFVTDCLETLSEISGELKEHYVASGGKEENFVYLPCLNDEQEFIDFLAEMVKKSASGFLL